MNGRFTTVLALAIAVAIVLAAVGCGGGGSSSSTSNGGASAGTGSSGEEPAGEEGSATESEAESSEEPTTESGEASSSLDKAAFVKKATEVCLEARKGALERINAYEEKHGGGGEVGAKLSGEAIRAVLISTIGDEIEGLEALGAPAGEEQEVEAMVAEMKQTLDRAKANPKLVYTEIEESFGPSDKKLEAYGLESCTKNGQA